MAEDARNRTEPLEFTDKEAWMAGQREALAAALNEAPLADSLGILVRTATAQFGPSVRAGFYLANAQGTALHHVVGMPAAYAEAVDGFQVGPDSLACGLATHTGQPVLTADVTKDPLWQPWLWMAEKFGYRACWSFPIHTKVRNFVGTLAIYWPQPCEATPRHCELVGMLTQAAGVIVARHKDSEIRKQAEDALRQNEERFRAFTEASFDVVYCMSPDWTEMRHLSGREFISDTLEPSRSWLDKYIHPDDQKLVMDTIHRAVRSKSVFELEHRVIQVDGTLGWTHSRAIPIVDQDGEIVEWFGAARDVTQRKRDEQALRDSEARFRMLADNMNQLAWTCDKLGDVTWYNKRWLDYTGLSFEEMKDWGWKQVQHPDHVDRVVASVTRSQENGEPWEDTFPLRGKDGQYRWFLSRAVPIRNSKGDIARWFGTNTDITDRKQAEDTLQLLLNELNHRVKNTLAVVQAIAQRTSARTRDPAEFAESFGGRIQSLARVHTLLSDANWQGADLRQLVRDQLLAGPVGESRMTARGPAVRLDPQMALHLALMLHELGTNSSKYGALSVPTGTVTVTWTTDDALHIRWVERGGPPVQAPSKRGFGISLIEQSAKGQGGDARMVCEADGITWEITLPIRDYAAFGLPPHILSPGKSAPRRAMSGPASKNLSGKRILVVEDEPMIGLDIAAALEEVEAKVTGPVGTADKAIDIIQQSSLDGALLDANLHGQTVDDIASALTRRNVPFIFITGHGRDGLPKSFRDVPALSKPCSRQQVIDAAAQLVTDRPNVVRLRS